MSASFGGSWDSNCGSTQFARAPRRARGIRPRRCPRQTSRPCSSRRTSGTTSTRRTTRGTTGSSSRRATPRLSSTGCSAPPARSPRRSSAPTASSARRLEGHPVPVLPWVDVATGSLGQGLPIGVGMAIAGKKLNRLPFRVWVICGDSEMAEGSMWEAAEHAAFYELDNLTAIIDVNRLGQRGETMHGWDLDLVREAVRGVRLARDRDRRPRRRGDRRRLPRGRVDDRQADRDRRAHGQGQGLLEGRERERLARQGDPRGGGRGDGRHPQPSVIDVAKPGARRARTGSRRARPHGRPTSPAAPSRRARRTAKPSPRSAPSAGTSSSSTERSPTRRSPSSSRTPTRNGSSRCTSRSSRWSPPASGCRCSAGSPSARPSPRSSAGRTTSSGWPPSAGRRSSSAARTPASRSARTARRRWASRTSRSSARSTARPCSIPCDGNQTAALVRAMADIEGISYLRTTRGDMTVVYGVDETFPVGGRRRSARATTSRSSPPGITLHEALRAAEALADEGIAARVIDCYSVKPIDSATPSRGLRMPIVTVEDHWAEGGLGEAVLSALAESGADHGSRSSRCGSWRIPASRRSCSRRRGSTPSTSPRRRGLRFARAASSASL